MKVRTTVILISVLIAILLTACSNGGTRPEPLSSSPAVSRGCGPYTSATDNARKKSEINELPVPSKSDKLVVELLDALDEPLVTDNEQKEYDAANDQFMKSDFLDSIKSFTDFIAKYPQSTLADDAQKMIGACYIDLYQYDDALNAFAKVILQYPNSSSIASAYYNIGYIYNYCLDDPDKSINYYIEALRNVRASDSFVLENSVETLKSISDIDVELGRSADPEYDLKHYNPPQIDLSEYNKIYGGYTYEDVVKIIGSEGSLVSESGTGEDKIEIYRWQGAGHSYAYAEITFKGGKAYKKNEYGLD